jgi:hypothetical protein
MSRNERALAILKVNNLVHILAEKFGFLPTQKLFGCRIHKVTQPSPSSA